MKGLVKENAASCNSTLLEKKQPCFKEFVTGYAKSAKFVRTVEFIYFRSSLLRKERERDLNLDVGLTTV